MYVSIKNYDETKHVTFLKNLFIVKTFSFIFYHHDLILNIHLFFWNWSKTSISAHSNLKKLDQNDYQRYMSLTMHKIARLVAGTLKCCCLT